MTTETVEGPITTDASGTAGAADIKQPDPGAQGKTTADLDAERTPRKPTEYVILAYAENAGGWLEVTTLTASNQTEAKKQAVTNNTVLRERLEEGKSITLVAVARPSWNPTTVAIKHTEDVVFS